LANLLAAARKNARWNLKVQKIRTDPILVSSALAGWNKLDSAIKENITGRAEELTEAHRRIRKAISVKMKVGGLIVKPQLPPDLLGLLVLQPVVMTSPK
jgi:hypothetical protein